MWCSKCGNELPDNAKFCDKCGNKIEVNMAEANKTEANVGRVNMASTFGAAQKLPAGVIAGIGAVAVAFVVLAVIVVGKLFGASSEKTATATGRVENSGKGKQTEEWVGYAAELEQGRHVKIATCSKYHFEFDVAGRLVYADVDSLTDSDTERIAKLCGGRVPVELSLAFEESNEGDFMFEKTLGMREGENYYTYEGDSAEKVELRTDGYRDVKYSFNPENGLVSYRAVKNDEGVWDSEFYYYYSNSKGNSLLTEVICGDNTTVLSYDGQKRLNYAEKTKSGEMEFVVDITYNEAGLVQRKYKYGREFFVGIDLGMKERYYLYEYDTENRLISVKNNDYEKTYKYDDTGRELLVKQTSAEGVDWEKSWAYDEKGNVTETVQYYEEGVHKTTEVKQYDKEENLTMLQEYAVYGGKPYLTEQVEYQYDRKGNLSKEKSASYSYEANSDFSVVNQIEANEGKWEKVKEEKEENDVWEITYYTDEEWEQYLHDKEFTAL